MDKILRIDMGADGGPAAKPEPLGDYAGFGGRGGPGPHARGDGQSDEVAEAVIVRP